MTIRPAAVAGQFYPAFADEIQTQISAWLTPTPGPQPKALVVPHAGYIYSGKVAAQAFQLLLNHSTTIERVVVMGPNHRVPLAGIAVPSVEQFQTPLGLIPLDQGSLAKVTARPSVLVSNEVHQQEHSIEVQLPFLQHCLGDFKLTPLVVGETAPEQVAQVLEQLWGDDKTLVVISTDLSHFLVYEEAQRVDDATLARILMGETHLTGQQACGCHGLNGFVMAAKRHGLRAELIEHCNSGDSCGDKKRVVGYASLAYFPHK